MSLKKMVLVMLAIVLLFATASAGDNHGKKRGKTEKMGNLNWYTEQNTLEEVLAAAQKENKPVMAVFSASWCQPCQMVKQMVFLNDGFKKVANQVVLLYVEQTTPEGAAYNKSYQIAQYPTFKMISKNGTLLDHGNPTRTVDGFLQWVTEVKAGNNFYQLSKQLEQKPSRETLLKITEKVAGNGEKIAYLKQAIAMKPDFNDALTQETYEKLADLLLKSALKEEGPAQADFVKTHSRMFKRIVEAYYPAKFKYTLKGNAAWSTIIQWFTLQREVPRALAVFNNFLKQQKEEAGLVGDFPVISAGVIAYVQGGNEKEGDAWLAKLWDISQKSCKTVPGFFMQYLEMYGAIIDYFGEKENLEGVGKYTTILYKEIDKIGFGAIKPMINHKLAVEYGYAATEILLDINKKLAADPAGMPEKDRFQLTLDKASILAKTGKHGETQKLLLQMEKESAHLYKDNHKVLDTLAGIHAKLGQYDKAVKIEQEAFEKAPTPAGKRKYSAKIKEWKKPRHGTLSTPDK